MIGLITAGGLIALGWNHWATGATAARGVLEPTGSNNIKAVAESLFTTFLWPFELTAVLLVIAVIGGVVLARRSHLPADEELHDLEEQDVMIRRAFLRILPPTTSRSRRSSSASARSGCSCAATCS